MDNKLAVVGADEDTEKVTISVSKKKSKKRETERSVVRTYEAMVMVKVDRSDKKHRTTWDDGDDKEG